MPPPQTETITLPDGRLLEYARYGDPAGTPALFFHGFIGSHHQASFAHESARRHGIQLIAPNRPGVGRSSPVYRRFITDGIPDVVALADALDLQTFGVIGVSGGVPYALACLAKLPERVRLGVLVSGLGPVADPLVLARMGPLARNALLLGKRFPWLVRAILALRVQRVRSNPDAFLSALIRRWSRTDRELFRRPEVRATLLADIKEVFVKGRAAEGLSREVQLYFRWGFRLDEIPSGARLLLFHGLDDLLVPPFMTEYAARNLAGAEATYLPGGHFMVIDRAEDLVRHARAVAGDFFPSAAQL